MSSWKISEVVDAIYFKSGNVSVHIFFTFSFTLEIEIKGAKDFGSFEKDHDKEKIEMVIEREAHEDRLAALLC